MVTWSSCFVRINIYGAFTVGFHKSIRWILFDFKPVTLLKMNSSKSIFQEFYLEFWLFFRTFLSILETAVFCNSCQWLLFILNKPQTSVYTFTLLPLIKRVCHFTIWRKSVHQLHLIIIRE